MNINNSGAAKVTTVTEDKDDDALSEVSENNIDEFGGDSTNDVDENGSITANIYNLFTSAYYNTSSPKNTTASTPKKAMPLDTNNKTTSSDAASTTSSGSSRDLKQPPIAQQQTTTAASAAAASATTTTTTTIKPPRIPKPSHNRVVSFAHDALHNSHYPNTPPPPAQEVRMRSDTAISDLGDRSIEKNPELTLPSMSNHTTTTKTLTLHTIRTTTPFESEAEAYIQNMLDVSDTDVKSTQQKTLLGDVPLTVKPETFMMEKHDNKFLSSSNHGKNKHQSRHHKKTTSTAEDLYALTVDLAGLHSRGLSRTQMSTRKLMNYNNGGFSDQHQPIDTLLGTSSDADAFTHNATNLIKRHNKHKTLVDYEVVIPRQEEEVQQFLQNHQQQPEAHPSDTTTTSTTAKKNWGKLKTAIQVTNAFSSSHPKKTDEELPSVHENTKDEDNENENDDDDDDDDDDVEAGGTTTTGNDKVSSSSSSTKEEEGDSDELDEYTERTRKRIWMRRAKKGLTSNYKDFEDWLKYKKISTKSYIKYVLLTLILPLTGVAVILYYLTGNPPCGTTIECKQQIYLQEQDAYIQEQLSSIVETADVAAAFNARFGVVPESVTEAPVATPMPTNATTTTTASGNTIANSIVSSAAFSNLFTSASVSWWLLFTVRQIITFSISLATQAFIVDYLALRSRWLVKTAGPLVTLFIVQSQGWPMVLFFWSVYDFLLLYGPGKFAHHWLYWQDLVSMMNEDNPSGSVTTNATYTAILSCSIVIASVVALKRFFIGLYLGRKTYLRYGNDLAKVMKKAVFITKVANLAREIEERTYIEKNRNDLDVSNMFGLDDETAPSSTRDNFDVDDTAEDALKGLGNKSEQKRKIYELLGAWEEPEVLKKKEETVAISSIIQFRETLSYLDTPFPFGVSFGRALSRVECIESSELVYRRLMLKTPNADVLKFDTLVTLAISRRSGDLDEQMAKDLIKIFRPDRNGNLSLVDFAKSVDTVYKELRLLRANVISSSKLDRAFGGIINIAFYLAVISISLAAIGVDPLILFASISSLVVGFAFMIGAAASKYFEGLLLILVRKPYDVGDRIHISDVNSETSITGSPGWIVKDVTLFTTTVVFGATNEVATYSNGSLASSRIINASRSPKANLLFFFKFPIDTPYKKIMVFKSAIEEFVKARPREWITFLAFRSTRVEADLGFVEYIVVAQHRESWQEIGTLLTSKADLSAFALELMKQMGIHYKAPPMPVDLRMNSQDLMNFSGMQMASSPGQANNYDRQSRGLSFDTNDGTVGSFFNPVAAMFEQPK